MSGLNESNGFGLAGPAHIRGTECSLAKHIRRNMQRRPEEIGTECPD